MKPIIKQIDDTIDETYKTKTWTKRVEMQEWNSIYHSGRRLKQREEKKYWVEVQRKAQMERRRRRRRRRRRKSLESVLCWRKRGIELRRAWFYRGKNWTGRKRVGEWVSSVKGIGVVTWRRKVGTACGLLQGNRRFLYKRPFTFQLRYLSLGTNWEYTIIAILDTNYESLHP